MKQKYAALLSDGKDRILDFNGLRTGSPFTLKSFITIVGCIAAFFLIRLLPLQAYGELTSTALAMVVVTIALLIFLDVSFIVPAIFLTVAGIKLGLWDYNGVKASIASSPFVMMFGMIIVAMGCEFTPMGKRIGYVLLKKFGRKPASLVIAIGIATAVLSSFVSNNAVIVMMSSICAVMLAEMKQVPGKSKLGKAIMIIVSAASMIGGVALVNGTPIGNGTGMSLLSEATGGISNISYLDWAKVGIPALLLVLFPMGWIYNKAYGVKNSDYADLPETETYAKLLKELGPITGSEIRWILTVIGMVLSMCLGMNTSVAALLWAVVAMSPLVGTVPSKTVLKKLPWTIMIAAMFIPIMGQCFSKHGIGQLVVDYVGPLFHGMSPFVFCFVAALFQGIIANAFVGASMAAQALGIGLLGPICVSLGYNPSLVMLPVLFINSCFFVLGFNVSMMINKEYGYWETTDTTVPGIILLVVCAFMFAVAACVFGPLFGLSLYL